MKKVVAFLTAFTLAAPAAGAQFYDISEDEARDKIEYLAEKGIIEGVGENLYSPQKTVTRAEFAAMAVRALGYSGGENTFLDVSETDWFFESVSAAENAGFISGFPDGTFRPYGVITHEQAVKMLVNIYETKYDIDPSGDMATMFDDYYEISDWARKSVSKGTALSIARSYKTIAHNNSGEIASADNGNRDDSGNAFAPRAQVTRSQAADMLYALLKALEISAKVEVVR